MRLKKIDPRIKLLILACLSTLSVVSQNVLQLAALFVLIFLMLVFGGVNIKEAVCRVKGMIKLIISLFIIQCIFNRAGDPLISVFGLTLITTGGVSASAVVTLRLIILLISAVVIMTSSSRDYLTAMMQIHIPYEIAFMVMAGLRFLPILREESQDIMCAVQMRGTKIKGTGLRKRAKIYISLLIPVVAGAIRRSEQMSVAMEMRCFRAYPKRTCMRRLTLHRSDWLYFSAFAVLFAFVAAMPAII